VSLKRKIILALLGLFIALISARWINCSGYMDADYYFSMGKVLASGQGLSEPFIWNYLSDPKGIPHPAFQYWMPFTSFLAALGQLMFGIGFREAQIPFILLAACFPLFTAWVAYRLHGDPQMAWESGLLAAAPGFFLPFWVTTDSFAIYGIVGSLIFILSVEAFRNGGVLRWLLIGILIGIAHLTRTDGILFLPLILGFIFFSKGQKKKALAGVIMGYLIAMLPWWILNKVLHGSAFPSGTMRILWTLDYDELFSYPPSKLTFERWLESGLGNILLVRLEALWMNVKNLILVNGLVFLGPLMVIGGRLLKERFLVRLVSIYLISLLIIMSFIFPFAGSRGGYFHSSMAAMPILWAVAPLGLRRVIKFGVRYRNWNHQQARDFFTVAVFILACLITLGIFWSRVIGKDFYNPTWSTGTNVYQEVAQWFEKEGVEEAVIAVNNPPGLYAASGLAAVVIPDGEDEVLRQVVDKFQVQWVLLDSNYPAGLKSLYEDPRRVEWLELAATLEDVNEKELFIYRTIEDIE
jgi:4-amino-4-deoxy-L-arabinose transferase-like glycosyltransferase